MLPARWSGCPDRRRFQGHGPAGVDQRLERFSLEHRCQLKSFAPIPCGDRGDVLLITRGCWEAEWLWQYSWDIGRRGCQEVNRHPTGPTDPISIRVSQVDPVLTGDASAGIQDGADAVTRNIELGTLKVSVPGSGDGDNAIPHGSPGGGCITALGGTIGTGKTAG